MSTLNGNCIKILTYLYKKNYVTEILSAKKEDIIKGKDLSNISTKTIIKYFKILKEAGYIGEGLKDGRFKKYYITDKGIELMIENARAVANAQKKQSLFT